MSNEATHVSLAEPISQMERIHILDSLRGIAILGILLMNIPGFGFPENHSYDPSIFNETGINFKTWYIIEWALAGTQRALFSMLFGAGIVLFITRLEKRMEGIAPAIYFFKRQLWLLFFGLINAFVLLWFWDILFGYAVCGMILFAFHRLSPKSLMIAGLICMLLMGVRINRDLYLEKGKITKGELIARIDTTKIKLTDRQKDELGAFNEIKEKADRASKVKTAKKEIQAIQGNYTDLYAYQSEKSAHVEMYYTYFLIWDILTFMFLGMAFYKNGILLGKGSYTLYWLMFVGGLGLGLLLSYLRLETLIVHNFNTVEFNRNISIDLFEPSRSLRAIGFFGLVMLLYKAGWIKWFFLLMRPLGQMAFTNYLMQSLVCGIFFYGIGLGYFGKLERFELYYVVAVVWAVEIIWSHIWLRYFRFGPLEWLWRSLTYWKKQPIRKEKI